MVIRVLLGIHYYSNAEVFRGSILWILGVLPSILDVCTAGTACTRRYVLLILPVLALFRPSVLLILRHSILLILQVLAVFAPSVLLILQVLAVLGPLPVLAVLRPSILRAITVVLFLSKNKKQKRSGSPLREIVKHKHIFYISYLQFLFFNASFFSEIGFW